MSYHTTAFTVSGREVGGWSIVSPVLFDGVLDSKENAMLLAFLRPEILESLQELLKRIYNNQTKDEEYPELQNMFLATSSTKEAFHKAHYASFPYLKLCWKAKDLQVDPKVPNSIDVYIHNFLNHVPGWTWPNKGLTPARIEISSIIAYANGPLQLSLTRLSYFSILSLSVLESTAIEQSVIFLQIYTHLQHIPGGIIVKRGPRVSSNEISALQLIANNPFVLPQPLDFVTDSKDGHSYLIMSHIPGQSFRSFCDPMTSLDLSSFTHDLRTILTEMRKIHNFYGVQAEAIICGANGNTPCHDFQL
ncbi:hypothetical protein EAE99_000778 [Botrytis elliptica]|nr:hypothetical protein EAE99_000778 [Botrytis elliptica]